MSWHDDLTSAFRHFARHKLRTGLAVLGIAASVASIIVMVSVADAMRRDKMSYFEEAGARTAQIVLLDKRGVEPVVAVLFALLVGMVSALGPALRASFIRPSEALRHE